MNAAPRFKAPEVQTAQCNSTWKSMEKTVCSTPQTGPWLALEPPPRMEKAINSKQQTPDTQPPQQRLKRQADSEVNSVGEEREEHSNVRPKYSHPTSLPHTYTGQLPLLAASQSEVFSPLPMQHQQEPASRDINWHPDQFNKQFQQSSYAFNEGLPQAQTAGRKRIKAQKRTAELRVHNKWKQEQMLSHQKATTNGSRFTLI